MNQHHSLMVWVECQKLFASLFRSAIEYGQTWPTKLGLAELAAIQTIDRPQDRDGWVRALSMSKTLQVEIIKVTKNTGFDVIEKDLAFVTPLGFSEYLKAINEQPSRLVAAWFEAFGVQFDQEPETEAVEADNNSEPRPSTAKEVFEFLKPMVKDEDKLRTLLFKNSSRTNWLSECKLGDGYNQPMLIKAHAKRGLLKDEYQKRFSDDAIEKSIAVNHP